MVFNSEHSCFVSLVAAFAHTGSTYMANRLFDVGFGGHVYWMCEMKETVQIKTWMQLLA